MKEKEKENENEKNIFQLKLVSANENIQNTEHWTVSILKLIHWNKRQCRSENGMKEHKW